MSLYSAYHINCDNVYCEHGDVITSDDIVKRKRLATKYFEEDGWIFVKTGDTFCSNKCKSDN